VRPEKGMYTRIMITGATRVGQDLWEVSELMLVEKLR
jgi:hypothetical protein